MKLLKNFFKAKWNIGFADNDTFDIKAKDLREFKDDIVDSFGDADPAGAVFMRLRNGETLFLLGQRLRDRNKLGLRRFSTGTLPAILPAPLLNPNAPAVAAPGSTFPLHASIGGPATGPAIIGEYTRQVSDGNHFQLTGAELAGATYPVYQAGNFYATSVSTQDAQKAAVRIPKTGAAFDAALTWPVTAAGIGTPVLLNVATFQWGEDVAAEGLTITQYGRNLAHGNVRGGLSYMALQLVSGGPVSIITGTAATPYEAAFRISGLAQGVYKKWLHNGHGGNYGWSEAGTLTIVDRQDHIMTRNFGAPVPLSLSPTDGVGNSQAIANMFRTLNAQGGGCFETQNGDFPSSEFIYPMDRVRWQCATASSGGRTRLSITGAWNANDCMLASNSWTLGALDGIAFYKPDNVTINVDALLIFNGSKHIRLDNVEATWKRPYDTTNIGGNQIPLNAQPLRITNSEYVFLNGCKQVGSGMHIGSRHNRGVGQSGISRMIFVRNHTARLTNGADYTIYVQNTDGILIDGLDWQDLDPNSTDGLQRGAGRGPKFGGQGGRNQNAHVGRCNGRYLGPLFTGTNIFYDRNQGENFLWEGNKLTWKNYVVSATATTLTFAQPVLSRLADVQAEILPADSDAAGVLPGLHLLGIVKGRGLWQVAGIASVSGNTITLDRPLAVIPDATSYVHVGCFTRNNAVVDCTVSGKPNIATDPDYAVLCGINWFGGCWNSVVDNLLSTAERHGLITSMTTHGDGDVDGCYFIEFRNSPPRNARWGIRFQACGHPNFLGWRFPVTAIGAVLVSNCQPTGSLVADVVYELPRDQAALDLWDAPPIDLVTIENQTSPAGVNEYRMASGPTNFPAIPVLPGAVANFAQRAIRAAVSPTAPGVQLTAGGELGPLEPLPATAAIDPATGVLRYPGTDPAILFAVDGTQETPLARTQEAGLGGGATPPPAGAAYADDHYVAKVDGAQPPITVAGALLFFNVSVEGEDLVRGLDYTDDGQGTLTIDARDPVKRDEVVQYSWLTSAVQAGPITGYTDAEIDAFLAGKAPLNLPLLAPFVGYVTGALVGFETFEQACDARPSVLHVRTPVVELVATNRAFNGVLYANDAEFTVPDGLELRLLRSSQVYNANVTTPGTGVIAVIGTGTPLGASTVPTPSECMQLIDCRMGAMRFAIDSFQGVVLRGNSTVDVLNTNAVHFGNVPVYLYDYSYPGTFYLSFDVVDYRPTAGGGGGGGGVTPAQLAAVATTLPLTPAHTADYTLQLSDIGALVPTSGSNPVTFTVPPGLGNAAPGAGTVGAARVCYPLQTGAGQLTLAAGSNVNLVYPPSGGPLAPGAGGRLILTWLDLNTVLVEGGTI